MAWSNAGRVVERCLRRCQRRFSTQGPWAGIQGLSEVVVVAAKRTPIGSFDGMLASIPACALGSHVIREALVQANLKPELVQEVFMGNVLSAGLGQAPARQAALGAGLSPECVCTTVNKVCASGMKAVMLGAQSIALGINEVVVAGGMESMSNAPYLLKRRTPIKRMGNMSLNDSLLTDGLWDPYNNFAMGNIAEICAEELKISREEQDDHAIRSYERATAAQVSGFFNAEIAPMTIIGKKGQGETIVNRDQECTKFDPDKLESLAPAFKEDGTVTAGNSSTISDGAAVLILTSAAFAAKQGLTILAHIRGFGDAEQAPTRFPTTPSLAIPRALKHAGLQLKDAELFEINEAFSVVDIANRQLLGLSADQVNIHGGAVSLGHPIGASGARIIMSLITGLAYKNLKLGVASVCNGGGGASAIVVERGENHRLHEHEHGQHQKLVDGSQA